MTNNNTDYDTAEKFLIMLKEKLDSVDSGDVLWAQDQLPIFKFPNVQKVNYDAYKMMVELFDPWWSETNKPAIAAIKREFDQRIFTENQRVKLFTETILSCIKNQQPGNWGPLFVELISITTDEDSLKYIIGTTYDKASSKQKYSAALGYLLKGLNAQKVIVDCTLLDLICDYPNVLKKFSKDFLEQLSLQEDEKVLERYFRGMEMIVNKPNIIHGILDLSAESSEVEIFKQFLSANLQNMEDSRDSIQVYFFYPKLSPNNFNEMFDMIVNTIIFTPNFKDQVVKYFVENLERLNNEQIARYIDKCITEGVGECAVIAALKDKGPLNIHLSDYKKQVCTVLENTELHIDDWLLVFNAVKKDKEFVEFAVKSIIKMFRKEIADGHPVHIPDSPVVYVHGWRELAKIMYNMSEMSNIYYERATILKLMTEAYNHHTSPLSYSSAKLLVALRPRDKELYNFLKHIGCSHSIHKQQLALKILQHFVDFSPKAKEFEVFHRVLEKVRKFTNFPIVKEMAERIMNL